MKIHNVDLLLEVRRLKGHFPVLSFGPVESEGDRLEIDGFVAEIINGLENKGYHVQAEPITVFDNGPIAPYLAGVGHYSIRLVELDA
jgi:hypothetical protein